MKPYVVYAGRGSGLGVAWQGAHPSEGVPVEGVSDRGKEVKRFSKESRAWEYAEYCKEVLGFKWAVVRFDSPKDPKQFRIESHCANGNIHGQDTCECGLKQIDCAHKCSDHIKEHHEILCGWSGFWCHGCGIFYANDTCGETFWIAEDILELRDDGYGYCRHCGAKLYKAEVGIDLPEPELE